MQITASYTGSSPIVGLVSRYHVIQVKSDNGKGVYYDEKVQVNHEKNAQIEHKKCFFFLYPVCQNFHFCYFLRIFGWDFHLSIISECCNFGTFRENYIFANRVERHIFHVKNSRL